MRAWLPDIRRGWGLKLSLSTLRRLTRRAGYRRKRGCRSLNAQRDPVLFAAAQQHLHALHQAKVRGALAVVYVDACTLPCPMPGNDTGRRRWA